MFNARVHYTVLTQHPEPATNTTTMNGIHQPVRHTKKGIMPQTPNNAPTYKQILFSNCARHCVSQSAIQTLGLCLKGVSSTRKFSNKQRWQHDTRTLNQHPPQSGRTRHNCAQIIKLLRKEVIHPHLPVRVPCYDFVPIADPTFDGSLTSLGHRLRVLPTFMT